MSKPFVSSTISGRGGEEGKRLPEESRIEREVGNIFGCIDVCAFFLHEEIDCFDA